MPRIGTADSSKEDKLTAVQAKLREAALHEDKRSREEGESAHTKMRQAAFHVDEQSKNSIEASDDEGHLTPIKEEPEPHDDSSPPTQMAPPPGQHPYPPQTTYPAGALSQQPSSAYGSSSAQPNLNYGYQAPSTNAYVPSTRAAEEQSALTTFCRHDFTQSAMPAQSSRSGSGAQGQAYGPSDEHVPGVRRRQSVQFGEEVDEDFIDDAPMKKPAGHPSYQQRRH